MSTAASSAGLATPAPAAAAARIDWLDAARGVGILLVVFGHALGGLADSNLKNIPSQFVQFIFIIYLFMMPIFFLLSGLLVSKRIDRNATGFRDSLWSSLAKPYFLWSIIQLTIIYLMQNFVNSPLENFWQNIVSLPWRPVSQFWFLHSLFLLHVFSLLFFRALGPVLFGAVLVSTKFFPEFIDMPMALRVLCNQAIFYGLGVVIGVSGLSSAIIERSQRFRIILLLVAVIVISMTYLHAPGLTNDFTFAAASAEQAIALAYNVAMIPAAFAGMAGIIALVSLVRGRANEVLAFLGRRSMVIFILHVLGVAGTRIICVNLLGITDPWTILGLSLIVGLAGPLIAYEVLNRLGLAKPLALG